MPKRKNNHQNSENESKSNAENIFEVGKEYYTSRKSKILAEFEEHAHNWKPFMLSRYGERFTDIILKEAREQTEELIPKIPYIGGDDNSMTHHLIRSTPSLAFYKVMKAHEKTVRETGKIIYEAIVKVIKQLPFSPAGSPSPEFIRKKKEEAKKSQERRYPEGWVWEFFEGDMINFDYGYDFYECGVQKYYKTQSAEEFLPYFCLLDFITVRASGQILMRTMTLAKGGEKCDFRFRSAENDQGWPPPFPEEEGET